MSVIFRSVGRRCLVIGILFSSLWLLAGADQAGTPQSEPVAALPATSFTKEANAQLLSSKDLNWLEDDDREFARRGLVCPLQTLKVLDDTGQTVWSNLSYDTLFASGNAPDSVNPSLWRHELLSAQHGLYQVAEGFYQVRGQDLSNLSLLVTPAGYIVIDPLACVETARAAMALVKSKLGDKPVIAVIYSHSHIDHFAGVKGVVDEADVKAGRVQIFAPTGFTKAAVEENVQAGNAMSRRAVYMYGAKLPVSARGQVGAGEGKAVSGGMRTLILPTHEIPENGESVSVGGVKLDFAYAPGEAPVGMHVFVPSCKTLYLADNCVHGLQNVYTIRGALTRDPLQWLDSIQKALDVVTAFDVDACCAGHNWPRFGKEKVKEYLLNQRDALKFMNDQTLRLLNMGYTGAEIEDMIKLPPELAGKWYLRNYYGDLRHNVRAIYTRYMGWYDANPANLQPLPPREEAAKTIEYMGGGDAVLDRAEKDLAAGQYRWVARVMDLLLWAQPDNQRAKLLAAAAQEQLGYQAECSTWRNAYLTAAQELRRGIDKQSHSSATPDIIAAMTIPMFFDYLAVKLNPGKAHGQNISINWQFTDTQQAYCLVLRNSVLTYSSGLSDDTVAGIAIQKLDMVRMIGGEVKLAELLKSGRARLTGDADKFKQLFGMLDSFDINFPVASHELLREP